MTAVDLLLAVRTVAESLELVGADVVEVILDDRHQRLLGAGGRAGRARDTDGRGYAPPSLTPSASICSRWSSVSSRRRISAIHCPSGNPFRR